jgi:hypothetical protein
MLIVISSSIFFITAIALIILIIYQPSSRYVWLAAIGGAILALASIFVWQAQMNVPLSVQLWKPVALFNNPIAFRPSGLSWPYALSIAALTLSVLLTAVARPNFTNSVTWAGTLAFGGLGLLAVTADNPLTLLLVWSALDLTELIVQLRSVDGRANSEKVVIAFSSRVLGIGLLAWANVVSVASGNSFDFSSMPASAGLYLVAAAGLRMGVLPLHLPYSAESALRRGFGTSLRLVSAASSLALLSHIPEESLTSWVAPFLLAFVIIAALYGGWMWLRAADELSGRPYWIISLAALSVTSALSGNPAGSVAWGCSLILAGGSLFLTSIQHVWVSRALLIGIFAMSTLPFSLTASAWQNTPGLFFPLVALVQALVMAGYIRHALRTSGREAFEAQPVWTNTVYPAGIGLLILMQLLLGLIGWDGARQTGALLLAIIASVLAFGLFWATPRFSIFNPVRTYRAGQSSAAEIGGYGFLWGIYQFFSQISSTISNTLEGDGGLMWTLLFLVLFVSLMTQGGL